MLRYVSRERPFETAYELSCAAMQRRNELLGIKRLGKQLEILDIVMTFGMATGLSHDGQLASIFIAPLYETPSGRLIVIVLFVPQSHT